MLRASLSLALLCAFAAPAAAQAPKSIDPGMTQAQVVERLGQPDATRSSGTFTYLFYRNGCVRQCGIDDVVMLDNDAVVDAVFRAPERAYTGKSSSPHAIPAELAARTRPGARDVPTGEVTQAGTPRPTSETKPEAEKQTPAEPAPTTEKEPSAPEHHEPAADSTKGRLRIKVKPQHGSTGSAARKDSAHTSSKAPGAVK
jgi:hypothetical protein